MLAWLAERAASLVPLTSLAAQVLEQAAALGEKINAKRSARGLRPRPVRAVVIGFPNVGKSALINRLLGRRVADSAPKPGVTRQLRWARIGGELSQR